MTQTPAPNPYWGGHGGVVNLLLGRGADVNFRNSWGKGLADYDCGECGVDFRTHGLR